MELTIFVSHILSKLEKMTVKEARAMMLALGFQSSSGSFKTAYFKNGCEFVFKILDKDGYHVGDLSDPLYFGRELGLNEFSSKFRVPVLARSENEHMHILIQEKLRPVWDYNARSKRRKDKHEFHSAQMRRLTKKARRAFDRANLVEGEDYYNDMGGNAGFDRNGNLLCFDGI